MSLALPDSVRMTPAPIEVPAAEQYTPGMTVVLVIGTVPSHVGLLVSSAP
jgi:hypothetical protein